MSPPVTRAASLRGAQQPGASKAIRRPFSDAAPKGTKKKGIPADAPRPGALPRSATVDGEVPPASGTGTVEDHRYHSRHALETATGREIGMVAEQPYFDGHATVARPEAEHNLRMDHLAARLDQLREGQHGLSIRAVEVESAIGSITSDLTALATRVDSLELNFNRPSRSEKPKFIHQRDPSQALQGGAGMPAPNHPTSLQHQRDLSQVPQRGAGTPAPRHQPSFEDHLPLNAQYSAPPLIPLNTDVVEFAGAPKAGAPRLITTATSSAPLPGGAKLPSLSAEVGPFAPGLEPLQTMLPPFARVVDYRRYRLDNTEPVPNGAELRHLYRLKTQIDGLYATLGTYSGPKPIALLGFLSTLKEAFNAYVVQWDLQGIKGVS